MADLKKTLPPSTAQARGISAVLDSCDGELEQLERETRAACRRLAAGTADGAGCTLWERELGLPVREDLSPDVRRALIAIALEAPQNTISSLAGKVGSLPGISVKTAYSSVNCEE